MPLASVHRLSAQKLRAQQAQLDFDRLGLHVLEEFPTPILLVNNYHQIVFANQALRSMTDFSPEEILGMRPGEVVRCENATRVEGGCGCAEVCTYCGAAEAVIESLKGESTSRECRINRQTSDGVEALDLKVFARTLDYAGEPFALVYMADISAEKRRSNLEQIFFHDILNVVGSIRGFTEILLDYDIENPREILQQLGEAAQQMVDEVEAQRLLSRAESGDIQLQRDPLESYQILDRVIATLKGHEVAKDREMVIDPESCREVFLSDPTLLIRSLVNLTKNALEASQPGGVVKLFCERDGDSIRFHVHNAGIMAYEVQQQMFQRSFSTKGGGRGVGTYSVRLLVERYLAGKVTFISDNTEGTRFSIALPA